MHLGGGLHVRRGCAEHCGWEGICEARSGVRSLFSSTSEESFGSGKWLLLTYSLPLKRPWLLLHVNNLLSAGCRVRPSAAVISPKSALTPRRFK